MPVRGLSDMHSGEARAANLFIVYLKELPLADHLQPATERAASE
jgi:hypothetical protein